MKTLEGESRSARRATETGWAALLCGGHRGCGWNVLGLGLVPSGTDFFLSFTGLIVLDKKNENKTLRKCDAQPSLSGLVF